MAAKNPYDYLRNMADGKTSTGGTANAGQMTWAKNRLAKGGYAPDPVNSGSVGSGANANTLALRKVRSEVSPSSVSTTVNPVIQPETRANETLGTIKSSIDSPAFEFKAPEKFTYDQNTDPLYQQALVSARKSAGIQQSDTNAKLRASGQGKSSYSETVANQIGADAIADVDANILPKLISQAYQQYSDSANRDLQVQQANYGVNQDRLSNLGSLYGLQNQEDFQNPITESQATGSYLSGEARQYIAKINELKRQAETPGITAEQRMGLSQQAEAFRSALTGLGVDASLFGANVNADAATQNIGKAGVQTVAEKQRIFQNDLVQKQFDQDVKISGLQYALNKQIQLGNLDINQAQLLLSQDDNDRQWAALDWEMSQPIKFDAPDYRGLNAGQVLDSLQSRYSEPVYQKDQAGNIYLDPETNLPKEIGKSVVTDPVKREQMFLDVIDSALPTDTETYQVLTMLGLTKAEIESYKKKYSGN